MPSLAGLRTWLTRFGNGLGVMSAVIYRLRNSGNPKLDGVLLECPITSNAWALTLQITGGEYDYPGFVPRDGWQVLDIGANIGIFSLLAARRGAEVQAYEASTGNFACLANNVRIRAVNAHHAAVVGLPPEGNMIELWLHDDVPSRNTLLGTEIVTGERLARSETVPSMALSGLLEGHRFDLVKLDVEGAEFSIFGDTDSQLLRCSERWVVEVHATAGDHEVLCEMFRNAGFTVSYHPELDSEELSHTSDGILLALRTD
jgi:FkbM family methyltransferase